jgi:mono/diheme cytochrome c family protein
MRPSQLVWFAAALASFVVGTAAGGQDTRKTVWGGVYTEGQAERGGQLFKKNCGHCHRDDLAGGGSEAGAPALKGPIFVFRWNGQPLAEMFLTIGTTMPQNAPDTLTPQTVADIVAFLLKSNDMPAGETELAPDVGALKEILLTEK